MSWQALTAIALILAVLAIIAAATAGERRYAERLPWSYLWPSLLAASAACGVAAAVVAWPA